MSIQIAIMTRADSGAAQVTAGPAATSFSPFEERVRLNGRRLALSNDEACDLVVALTDGTLDVVEQIAARLARAIQPWT